MNPRQRFLVVRIPPFVPRLFLLLLTFGVWALILYYRSGVPSESDWRSVAEVVRQSRELSDGLTWVPFYMEAGTPYFDGLNPIETPSTDSIDFSRFSRVWVVDVNNAWDPSKFATLESELIHESGPLTLWRVRNHGEHVVASLYDELENVIVRTPRGELCDFWSGKGWHCLPKKDHAEARACLAESTKQRLSRFRRRRDPHCKLSPWFHVSRDLRVIGRFARQCVWIHPRKKNPFVLNWQPSQMGKDLVLRYGFTDRVISMHSRPQPRTQTATLTLKGFGEPKIIEVPAAEGWFEKRYEVFADAPSGALTLTVTTADPVDAHFCVDLSLRGRGDGNDN